MNPSAGWYPTDEPAWLRWWDGKTWHNAYWPARNAPRDYLPEATRIDISGSGEPWFNIVGENYRSEAIAATIGEYPARDVEVVRNAVAELVPEPDNPHARSGRAISVRVGGRVVGYLPDVEAPRYWDLVCRFIGSWQVPVVRANIWAVTRWSAQRNRDELHANVRLALPDPELAFPENGAPARPHRRLPIGRSIAVQGEEQHFEELSPYCRDGQPSLVAVTLHPIEVKKARSVVTVVEVRLDGERVGQLLPAASESLLRLIAEVEDQGLVTAAWARVTGSRFAAQIELLVQKPQEIPDQWPGASDVFPQVGEAYPPPAAYFDAASVPVAPLGGGVRPWLWLTTVLLALVLLVIPYVGWLFALGLLGLVFWWHLASRNKPSSRAYRRPEGAVEQTDGA